MRNIVKTLVFLAVMAVVCFFVAKPLGGWLLDYAYTDCESVPNRPNYPNATPQDCVAAVKEAEPVLYVAVAILAACLFALISKFISGLFRIRNIEKAKRSKGPTVYARN